RGDRDPRCRRPMIDAVLHEALAAGRAAGGWVRLADPAVNALVPESHHGCDDALLDHLLRGRASDTADGAARSTGRRVGVPDVAGDPRLGDDGRRALLAAGVRALVTLPVVSAAGSCAGVITLHWPHAGHRPTAAQTRALDALAAETAAWLGWYHRSVVMDALEDLHGTLTGAPG
ncbi:GAF domain-containing protein, partial [Streptomyces collinus]